MVKTLDVSKELTSNSDIIVTYPLNVPNHRDSLIRSLYNPVSNSKVDGLQFQTHESSFLPKRQFCYVVLCYITAWPLARNIYS